MCDWEGLDPPLLTVEVEKKFYKRYKASDIQKLRMTLSWELEKYQGPQSYNCACLGAQFCSTLCNPMDCIPPLSIGFSRQEFCSWFVLNSANNLKRLQVDSPLKLTEKNTDKLTCCFVRLRPQKPTKPIGFQT